MVNTQAQPRRPFNLGEEQAWLVLALGTLLGVALVVTGLVFTVLWWNAVVGGLEEWRKQWWRLGVCALAVFGGLGVMFGALSVARSEAHAYPTLRRVLYGYNAVLTSLLLLAILAVFNILAYVPFRPFSYLNRTYDWTQATIYSLTPETRQFLEGLKQPVKVYVLLPERDPYATQQIHTFMDDCRAVTNKFEVTYYSPDLSPKKIQELDDKYQLPESRGILVVYGEETPVNSQFIRFQDVFAEQVDKEGNDHIQFKGESALMGKLTYLVQGKAHAVVYFAQENGEPALSGGGENALDPGLGRLQEKLTAAGYDIKPLALTASLERVPEDASIVVIARPTKALPESALKALDRYMNPPPDTQEGPEAKKEDDKKAETKKPKKGKLIVLLAAPRPNQDVALQTQMAGWLRQYGVQLGDNHIIGVETPSPLDIVTSANLGVENPVVNKFRGVPLEFQDVRTVDPLPPNQAQTSPYHARPILLAVPDYGIWAETNLSADPDDLVKYLSRPENHADLIKKVSQTPLSVAVAVTENGPPPAPTGDPHDMLRHGDEVPRLLVFGNASWINDRNIDHPNMYPLITGSLAWLRELPDVSSAIEPKERKPFVLDVANPGATGEKTDTTAPHVRTRAELYWEIVLVPLLLVLVGVIGLGAGVWIVRRR